MSWYLDKQYIKNIQESYKTNVLYQEHFKEIKGKILDVGCTTGWFTKLNLKQIQGIDNDKQAIRFCKQRKMNVKYMDVEKKLKYKNNTFNGIFVGYLIEHIKDSKHLLNETYRILKPKGKLIVITENWKKTYKDFYDDPTHMKPYTKISLEKVVYESKYTNYKIEDERKPIKGLGWLVRKKIITTKTAIKIINVLYKLKIRGNGIILTAYK